MPKHPIFKPAQKARAVLQVLTGEKSAAQIGRELQIHQNLFSRWKAQFLDQVSLVFEKESPSEQSNERIVELERLVGRLTLELEASKKSRDSWTLAQAEAGGRDELESLLSDQPAL